MIVNWYSDDSKFLCEISVVVVVVQCSRSVGRLSSTPFFSLVSVSNFSIDC